ncbi:MAG: ankyrin repeat domain-containing protein, partial [Proteobacteria bacterium]|nr:ankyrin repeat domain-containing protein [Pseudomonadota bacterium]
VLSLTDSIPPATQALPSVRDPFGRFQKSIQSLLRKGQRALSRGRLEEAAAIFRRVIEKDPGNKTALAGLERIKAATRGRRAETVKRRQEAEKRKRVAAALGRAERARAAGRLDRARDLYARVLKLDPSNQPAKAGLIRIREALFDRPVGRAVARAVFQAARAGDVKKIGLVLRAHPGAARAKNKADETPLHVSAQGGRAAAALVLIRSGGRIDARDKWGYTPLHRAAFSGLVSVGATLLAKGAGVDPRDKWGNTPLHVAAAQGHVGLAALLIRAGADLAARDKDGRTPLHKASLNDQWPVAALLLLRGADVNARDGRRRTPLHLAAYYGRPLMARLLIKKGARLAAEDDYGRSAYAVADRLCRGNRRARDCAGILDLLTAHGLTK